MKVQLNTNLVPLFSGTYETQWEVSERDDFGNEQNVVYNHVEFMESIKKAYNNNSEWILREIQDTGAVFVKNITFNGVFSPREYNFKTDELDFKAVIDKKLMLKTLKGLYNDKNFQEYLSEKFTSCDGFWSWTPNNYIELYEQIVQCGQEFEQSVGALIRYFVNPDNEYFSGIESEVYDWWQGNGYGGLEYHVECWECNEKLEYPYIHTCLKQAVV